MAEKEINIEGVTDEERAAKRLEFPNQLMFRKVMEADNGICEAFLELVLGIPIDHVEKKHVEDVKNPTIASRGVRLDVFVKASDKVIDLEMQASEPYALGKRMRYYQGAMDVSELMPGDEVEDLLESYVVFVCRRDPFGLGFPRYELEPRCRQAIDLDISADMHWLVLNASAFERVDDRRLRTLLEYISCGTVAEEDSLIRNIAEEVERINRSDKEVKMFWTLEDEFRLQTKHKVAEAAEEAAAEGRAEGEARLSALMDKLLGSDRIEDAKRAAIDDAYRQELFKEFGIA